MAKFVTFKDVPIGGRFLWMGKAFTKTAMSMAEDNQRMGHVFGFIPEGEENYDGVHPVEPIPDFPRAPDVPAARPCPHIPFQSLGPFIPQPWRRG